MSPVMKVAGVLVKELKTFGTRAKLATSVTTDRSTKYSSAPFKTKLSIVNEFVMGLVEPGFSSPETTTAKD